MLQYLDSDDDFESVSDLSKLDDDHLYSSCVNESFTEAPIASSHSHETSMFSKNQSGSVFDLNAKLQEQTIEIRRLKSEKIGFLEQITGLCSAVESKEREIYELIQSYEHKVSDIAQYMSEVQGMVSQLSETFNKEIDTTKSNGWNGLRTNGLDPASCDVSEWDAWNTKGRALLSALSEKVETISSKNMEKAKSVTKRTRKHVPETKTNSTDKESARSVTGADSLELDSLRSTVCQLPVFCWSAEHVLYWLREYVCLPGPNLELARTLKLDGKQLASLPAAKADKLFHLNDNGLRRKLQLALEDLRVHGSPGLSRVPGPSHIDPTWICDVWLRKHLGLAHLSPIFAYRRVDGRMLASLISYRPFSRRSVKSVINFRNRGLSFHQSRRTIECNGSLVQLPSSPQSTSDQSWPESSSVTDLDAEGRWCIAGRREMNQILLGLKSDASSGSRMPGKLRRGLLNRSEILSLRAGIELLRRYNFNIEQLENARTAGQNSNEQVLLWTNERVAKWLGEIGLSEFTHGIDGSGLHGALMVLDRSFDVLRLMTLLNIPSSVAATYEVADHLESILVPAKKCEGIFPKRNKFFRRRSTSRLNNPGRGYKDMASAESLDHGTPIPQINLANTRSEVEVGNQRQNGTRYFNVHDTVNIMPGKKSTELSTNAETRNGIRQDSKHHISILNTKTPDHCQLSPKKCSPENENRIARYAIMSCEAPLIDPFNGHAKGNRTRILLGRTHRQRDKNPLPDSRISLAANEDHEQHAIGENSSNGCGIYGSRAPICRNEFMLIESPCIVNGD